ncbi:DUF6455 family protein [Roseovarius sp. D22-M7]|uniref:DUF6455 family protein n=1 Tax=Roseovarius sp. D22-M7 TaxID=3127116 RepID=UPI00300FA6A0
MQNRATLKHHADLVDRMANIQGLDLEERIMAGAMRPDELSDAVLACTGCASADGCAQWLDRTESAEKTPDYCRNAELFSRLRLDRR